jgi:hypothetical protein
MNTLEKITKLKERFDGTEKTYKEGIKQIYEEGNTLFQEMQIYEVDNETAATCLNVLERCRGYLK